jgi:hypothetical protein
MAVPQPLFCRFPDGRSQLSGCQASVRARVRGLESSPGRPEIEPAFCPRRSFIAERAGRLDRWPERWLMRLDPEPPGWPADCSPCGDRDSAKLADNFTVTARDPGQLSKRRGLSRGSGRAQRQGHPIALDGPDEAVLAVLRDVIEGCCWRAILSDPARRLRALHPLEPPRCAVRDCGRGSTPRGIRRPLPGWSRLARSQPSGSQ